MTLTTMIALSSTSVHEKLRTVNEEIGKHDRQATFQGLMSRLQMSFFLFKVNTLGKLPLALKKTDR